MYTLADQIQDMGDVEKGVIKAIYEDMGGGRNNILSVMPIGSVDTLVSNFLVEADEGPATGIGSRPIYGAYPEGTAAHQLRGFTVGDIGGRAAIDEVFTLQKGYAPGVDPEVYQKQAKSKLLNRKMNDGIVNGDRATDPNFFDGWRKWVVTNQILQASSFGAYTNGLILSGGATADQKAFLYAMDTLVERIGGFDNPDCYIVANGPARRQIRKAVRELGWFGTNGAFYDTRVDNYGGVKFLDPGSKTATTTQAAAEANGVAILPNNLAYGSNSTVCEIWGVRMSLENGMGLYQLRPFTPAKGCSKRPR
jgi:hypothetical protein